MEILTKEGIILLEEELRECTSLRNKFQIEVNTQESKLSSEDFSTDTDSSLMTNLDYYNTKITKIKKLLANSQVLDDLDTPVTPGIRLGDYVVIESIEEGDIDRYRIVSSAESKFVEQSISVVSCLGQELLGKSVGDTVTIQVPRSEDTLSYVILDIMSNTELIGMEHTSISV